MENLQAVQLKALAPLAGAFLRYRAYTPTARYWPSDDARQYASPGRAFAVGRLRALPPRSGVECEQLWRCCPGACLRPADGLHGLRNRRRTRPAELAGASSIRELDRQAMMISGPEEKRSSPGA